MGATRAPDEGYCRPSNGLVHIGNLGE